MSGGPSTGVFDWFKYAWPPHELLFVNATSKELTFPVQFPGNLYTLSEAMNFIWAG